MQHCYVTLCLSLINKAIMHLSPVTYHVKPQGWGGGGGVCGQTQGNLTFPWKRVSNSPASGDTYIVYFTFPTFTNYHNFFH